MLPVHAMVVEPALEEHLQGHSIVLHRLEVHVCAQGHGVFCVRGERGPRGSDWCTPWPPCTL